MGDVADNEQIRMIQERSAPASLFVLLKYKLQVKIALWLTIVFLVIEAILVVITPTGETVNLLAVILLHGYYFYIATPIVICVLAMIIYNIAPRFCGKRCIEPKQQVVFGILSLILSIVAIKTVVNTLFISTLHIDYMVQIFELAVVGVALLALISASIYIKIEPHST